MRDEEIHVGDVLRIRDWNDMACEFSGSDREHIPMLPKRTSFVRSMQRYCGEVYTVSAINKEYGMTVYKFKETSGINNWLVCSEMLEPVEDEVVDVATDNEIALLLS